MRNTAFALIFAVVAAMLPAYTGSALAQTNGQPTAGPASSVVIPDNFNQPPSTAAAAGDGPAQIKAEAQQPGTVVINGVRYYLTTKTQYEFWLALMTVVIGLSAMALVCFCFLFSNHLAPKTDDFVKLFAFVVVVFSAMFLIAVGYNDSQTAPVYSLLGTIIGYIFGREITGRQQRQEVATAAADPAPPRAPTANTGGAGQQ